jgi:sortase (surface protein transpeptidase)
MATSVRRGRRGLLLLAAAVLAVLAAVALVLSAREPADVAAPASDTGQQAAQLPPAGSSAGPAAMAKSDPVSVDVPKIGVHSTLISLGLNADNTVQVPPLSNPMQAGWYEYGPTPGELGPAVILGHIDGNKDKGVFYDLKKLAPGDDIAVARQDGTTAHFVVYKTDLVPKDAFQPDAVYGNTPGPELRLITCGGSFDRAAHNYLDNVIVYAKLASG